MNWKTRLMVRESALTAGAFTAALYAYYFFAVWGVQDNFSEGPLRDYLTSPAVHVELLVSGLAFGGLIGVINRIVETPRFRNRPVGQLVLFRTFMYLVSLAVVSSGVLLLFAAVILPREVMAEIFRALPLRYTLSSALFAVLAVVAINFALEVGRVVGPGNLWRLLIGRYRRPREEERVFLFMDLKGSTTTAEELGHRRYSELLQECYRDLTEVVMRYEAAVYQYVGDEVVLSWPIASHAERTRASVQAFFAYQRALTLKRGTYETRFGMVPEFRGGIDLGLVTVIEVGDVKREIVYHGDVLNTAARLLELCKTRGEELVVSHSVGKAVELDLDVLANWHGEVPLRGKRMPVDAYGLRAADTSH